MVDFEERSGIVSQETPWGRWYQSVTDVTVEVNLTSGTRGREVQVDIQPSTIHCSVRGSQIFQGGLCETVLADESTWTIEDSQLLRILLVKAGGRREYWPSLLRGQFQADPFTLHSMRQKLDLERYQLENPGFDFSGATLDKKYEDWPGLPDHLSQQGATALPLPSISGNKTDDEKLLEAQLAVGSPSGRGGGGTAAGQPVELPLADQLLTLHSTSDDARTAASSGPVPDPVVTDDMKTSASDSLETDEEKGRE